jgi:hypothetical protein
MNEQIPLDQRYMISVYEPIEADGAFIFSFGHKGLTHDRGIDGSLKRVPKFIVAVRQEADRVTFDWTATQDDPGADRDLMEAEVTLRLKARAIWIDRVAVLITQVEQWARDLGWSTRRVEKRLEDAWIGKHSVAALLMQEDACRILLEPVGRSTPGTEGVVDLYLMPAYDDIATLYYYGGQWNLHYMFPGAKPVATVREAEAVPLSKMTLEKVLGELRKHAA